ncbi:MAG: hypothetical protein FJ280_19730 [Planctomycetes bacterium]|uniref:Uncharacterized protein n=1 Tax=Eiseniibacteriota bacterium TaxID=2212470 RepID=A0A937X8C1_UNCEI|nr:hypothetical protein [Candidatus Eisenbacteria bacterium]MBM4027609.1 hypothetical protein [Planctomycetota bacterium]
MGRTRFLATPLLFVGVCALLGGCAPQLIRYRFDPPAESRTMEVTGLSKKSRVVEMVDRLDSYCATGDTLILIAEENKTRQAYLLCTVTGAAKPFKELPAIKGKDTYFWDTLTHTKIDQGAECAKMTCFAMLGVFYSSDKYGFTATKKLSCDGGPEAHVSFQLSRVSLAGDGVSRQSVQAGLTLRFVDGEEIIEITPNDRRGYFHAYAQKGTVVKSRYYLLSDGSVMGCTPDRALPEQPYTNVFLYDLAERGSWGAELVFDDKLPYNDFGVVGDGTRAVFLLGTRGDYWIQVYEASKLAFTVKMFRSVMEADRPSSRSSRSQGARNP